MNIKRKIFEHIVDAKARWNVFPTKSEIRSMFSALTDDVNLHLEQLEREGLLVLGKTSNDTLAVAATLNQLRRVPMQGDGPARHARGAHRASAVAEIGLDLRAAGIPMEGPFFAQIACDNSMVDAGIEAGDVAIFSDASPVRGDIVTVEIAGRLTLRRYLILAGIPHLLAENRIRPDIVPAYDMSLRGALWAVLRMQPKRRPVATRISRKINYRKHGGLDPTDPVFFSSGERLLMSRADWSAVLSRAECGGKRANQSGRKGRRSAKLKPLWPKPPSGAALNDKESAVYGPGGNRSICDEQPDVRYNGRFADELVRFGESQRKANKSLKHEVSVSPVKMP